MAKVRKAATAVITADRRVTHRAASERGNPVVEALGGLSEAADQPPLIALGIATAFLGLVVRNPVMMRGGVRMLAAELVATGLKSVIKHRVDRTRPAKAIERGHHRFALGGSHDHDENSSPSGHTAGAVAVARAVAREVPAAALPAYAVATAVGAVQLPRGKHYALDVIAGAVIGYVAEAGAAWLLRRVGPAWHGAKLKARAGAGS